MDDQLPPGTSHGEALEADDAVIHTLVDERHMHGEPLTPRGVRTRNALVAAARTVFERDGFIDARLVDITKEAQCSVGTFYLYFESKKQIFTAVMKAAQDDMMNPGFPHVDDAVDNYAALIEASVRAYLGAYRRNAKLMMLLEQVAIVDPEFRELRIARGEAFAARNATKIRQLQEAGKADPSLEPLMTARGLSAIISRFAFYSYGLEQGWDDEVAIEMITKLWINGLGMGHRAE